MRDYVVYHKAERMGLMAIDVDQLVVYTNKDVSSAIGARVWLLTGEGRPRIYRLRSTFIVSRVTVSDRPGFNTKVTGKDGRLLDPMPVLNDEPWFCDFREKQGNFAFGFQQIGDPVVEAGLCKVLREASDG